MERVTLTKAAEGRRLEPAQWRHSGVHVIVSCGKCGSTAVLDHEIDATTGDLSPSLVCPDEACGWHVHARLGDYP